MNSILDDFKMAFRSGNILNQIIVINVVAFIGINIVLGVFMTIGGQEPLYRTIYDYLALPSNTNVLITQPQSLITYMFLHRGIFHTLFNMLFLYWFGRIITEYLGQNKILGLYVWGGLAGGLLYLLVYNLVPYYQGVAQFASLAGASAGVLAVVVGAATFQPDFRVNLLLLGPVKIKYIAAFVVLSSLYNSTGANAGGEIAHLGGALLGYLFMTQLQKGNDWSKPVVSFIHWFKSFFKPQPKIKVSYKNEEKFGKKTKQKSRPSKVKKTKAAESTSSQAEIDAILDKISDKGYDALSKEEKQKLFNASKQ